MQRQLLARLGFALALSAEICVAELKVLGLGELVEAIAHALAVLQLKREVCERVVRNGRAAAVFAQHLRPDDARKNLIDGGRELQMPVGSRPLFFKLESVDFCIGFHSVRMELFEEVDEVLVRVFLLSRPVGFDHLTYVLCEGCGSEALALRVDHLEEACFEGLVPVFLKIVPADDVAVAVGRHDQIHYRWRANKTLEYCIQETGVAQVDQTCSHFGLRATPCVV